MDDGTLHAYLDGELSPVERGRLETHLAECPACRQRLDEERALIGRASAVLGFARPAERPAPPLDGLHPARRSWWISRPLAWAATVVLAVGFGYYLRGADAVRSAPKQLESVAVTADSVGPAEPARPSAEVADRMMYSGQDRDDSAVRQPPVRTESVGKIAPAAGVVGFRDAPPLRQAAPEPVPPAAPPQAAARFEADARLAEARGRLVATEWPIIRREPARRLLGADPLGVPGLAVRGIRRSPAGDGVVVVEQTIDSGTVIQLFQQRVEADGLERRSARALAAEEREGARANANERLARFVGSLRIEIAGPLTPDSLNKLLALLAPIP